MPTVPFGEDFDGMAEGLSPPTDYIKDTGSYPPDICEVDDAQYRSSPHSTKVYDTGIGFYRLPIPAGFTTEKITRWYYFDSTTGTRYLFSQSTTGNYDNTKLASYISFRNTGDIKYNDGAWQDTGYNYTTGWHKIEVVHNLGADTFDAWYDDTLIISGGAYYGGSTGYTSIKGVFGGVSGANLWIDDDAIGGWDGKVIGVTNPAKIIGVAKTSFDSVVGVLSA